MHSTKCNEVGYWMEKCHRNSRFPRKKENAQYELIFMARIGINYSKQRFYSLICIYVFNLTYAIGPFSRLTLFNFPEPNIIFMMLSVY